MKKIYDLAVRTGSYEKHGEIKNRYEPVGAIMENENGKFMFLKRSFNPAGVPFKEGASDILIGMFKPRVDGNPMSDDDIPM